tara:strand:- start:117144 stop:118367 length:1224 start_codon:yes stop_codon:yes gene_type:complete
MHILFLSDNFPPEGNAPASRTYEHAKEWVKLGHKVTVITCAPNFPDGIVFEGYRNSWYQKANMDGIRVIRVKTYITANEGFTRRILDYLSYALMAFLVGLLEKRPDVIVGTSPQFFTALSAWLLSAVKRKPFIFELRDIWPASIIEVGAMKKGLLIRQLEKLELFLYRRAKCIISVTHAFREELVQRGIDESKIVVVLNGVDLSLYQPAKKKCAEYLDQFDLREKFVVGYVGTLGMAHALGNVLDTAEMLRGYSGIKFVIAGSGAERVLLEQRITNEGLDNVVLIPRQPKERMADLWSICDISLVHLKNTPLFKTVIPSKIFESMGMGLPIIIAQPEGEATEIVASNGVGIAVLPEMPGALKKAVLKLYEDADFYKQLTVKSRQAAELYNRKVMAKKMLGFLKIASD